MAYIDELLGRGENILYVGRQHMFVLVSNILAELSLIALLIAAGVFSQRYLTTVSVSGFPGGQLVLFVCGAISVIVLISAFLDYLRWNNEQYVVTDHRVIQVRGIDDVEAAELLARFGERAIGNDRFSLAHPDACRRLHQSQRRGGDELALGVQILREQGRFCVTALTLGLRHRFFVHVNQQHVFHFFLPPA